MNSENLINLKNRDLEERIRIAKLGAKASAKKRKENKSLKEELLILLDSLDDSGLSKREKISASLIKQAENGNVRAFELIQNIVYGKPISQIELNSKQVPCIVDDIL